MESAMRRTGIDVIGEVPWGTHFCQFYESSQDLIELLVPYFKEGLAANEFCMWVTSEPLQVDQATAALRAAVPNLDDYIDKGQIEILDYSQWYTRSGKFSADEVLLGWVEKLKAAQEQGYEGLRLTGNTFWLEKADWDDFTRYEETVNSVIGRYPMLAICTYSLQKCNAVELLDVVANHQFAMIKRSGRWEIIESAQHKRTGIALQKSEDRFATILASIGDAVITTNIEGKITFMNGVAEKLTGWKFDDASMLPAKTVFNIINEYTRREVDDPITKVLDNGTIVGLANHTILIQRDGSEVAIDDSGAPIRDRSGDVMGVVLVFRDITEHKRVEDELSAAKDRMAEDLDVMARLHKISERFVGQGDLQEILDEIVETAIAITHADMGNIQLFDASSGSLQIMANHGFEQPFLDYWNSVHKGQGACGTALGRGERVIVEDVTKSPIFVGSPALQVQLDAGVRAVQATPLLNRSGNPLGMLSTHYRTPRRPDEPDLQRLDLLTRLTADIIERSQAEEEQARLASFPKLNPNPIIEVDRAGKVQFLNPAAQQLFPDLQKSEGRHPLLADWEAVMLAFSDDETRTYVRDISVGERWYQQAMYSLRGKGNIRTYGLDITERKQAEIRLQEANEEQEVISEELRQQNDELIRSQSALHESEERFRLMIESVKDYAIFMLDPEGRVVTWNEGAERLKGYKPEEIIGQDISIFYTPEDVVQNKPYALLDAAISQEHAEEDGWRVRKDGSRFWASVDITALRDKQGKLRGFVKVIRDITEHKRMDEALREAKDYLESLINYANAPIIVWDTSFNITRFNHAFEKLTGLYARDVLSKPLEILFPDVDKDNSLALIRRTNSGERWEVVEIPILRTDGSVRTVLWNSANIYGKDGATPVATIAQGQDITERKLAEEELRKSYVFSSHVN